MPLKLLWRPLSVMIGVATVVFVLFQGLGDPTKLLIGQQADEQTQKTIRRELFLNEPTWKQFIYFLNDLSPLAVHQRSRIEETGMKGFFLGKETCLALKIPYLRRSYQSRKPVSEMILDVLPGTMLLAFTAVLFAATLGIVFGMICAWRKNTFTDGLIQFISISGISAPSFFTGILVSFIGGYVLHETTGLNMTGSLYEIDPIEGPHLAWKNLILPAFTLGIRPLAIITQLTRTAMLDVLSQDYIRTARAKGLSTLRIYFKHALPNALNPVLTSITGWFAELLAGAFFIEYIFGWKGLGKLTVEALDKLDLPVLMGSVLTTAFFFTLMNSITNWLYRWNDPRVGAE